LNPSPVKQVLVANSAQETFSAKKNIKSLQFPAATTAALMLLVEAQNKNIP
jgi:hypothetical protein